MTKEEWKLTVHALDRDCIMADRSSRDAHAADPCEGSVQAHHVITQQQLRHLGLDDQLWNPANGASLCERHHRRHHNRRQPVPWQRLPDRCRKFAHELGVSYLLDRYYT
jgi:hypothetical protein